MSLPPAKRQRTENALITRSEIWYDEGSVVLQAENTQFRVHWGVLSQNSYFFRDMKRLPQPLDQPNVEGCPIVELHDSVVDVEYLLKALYNATYLTQKALSFPAVAALVRLGRKYDFRDILESVVERLTFENPATLAEYDGLLANEGYTTTRIVHYHGILYDMLTLARENDILSALPCAYYRAIRKHNRAQFFDGVRRENGTAASLGAIDVRRCVLGREKLLQTQWAPGNTMEWLESRHDDGCTVPRCGSWRDRQMNIALISGKLGAFLPPSALTDVGLCAACLRHAVQSISAGRKKMWDELPSFFDLPPWSELRNNL